MRCVTFPFSFSLFALHTKLEYIRSHVMIFYNIDWEKEENPIDEVMK